MSSSSVMQSQGKYDRFLRNLLLIISLVLAAGWAFTYYSMKDEVDRLARANTQLPQQIGGTKRPPTVEPVREELNTCLERYGMVVGDSARYSRALELLGPACRSWADRAIVPNCEINVPSGIGRCSTGVKPGLALPVVGCPATAFDLKHLDPPSVDGR